MNPQDNTQTPDTLPANFDFGSNNTQTPAPSGTFNSTDNSAPPDTLPANFDFNSNNQSSSNQTQTPSSTDNPPLWGLGSGFAQSIQQSADQTPAQFIAQDNQQSHAFLPANQDFTQNFQDPNAGPGSILSTADGAVLNAAKAIPNLASDFLFNVAPGVAGIFGNLASTAWNTGKGMLTGDYSSAVKDLSDGIVGQLWRDPSAIAGSATRAAGFALGKGIDQFWNGDFEGGLGTIAQGALNFGTAVEDAPMSNLIAFKALGGISDTIQNPIETAQKALETGKNVKEAITHPIEFAKDTYESLKSIIPETLQTYTKSGVLKTLQTYGEKINQNLETTKNISKMDESLNSNDIFGTEKSVLQSKIANAEDILKKNYQETSAINQLTLSHTQDGLKIASGNLNPDQLVSSIQKIGEDQGQIAKSGYQTLLPRTIPDYQPILASLKDFLDNKINAQDDPQTYKEFKNKYDDLKARVDLNDAWQKTGGNNTSFIKEALNKGINYEDINKFIENPNSPEYRLNSTIELKSDTKGTWNAIKEDSPLKNTKNLYNGIRSDGTIDPTAINPTIEKTIQDEIQKAHGTEGLTAYQKANSQWGNAIDIARQITDKIKNATSDTSAETHLRNNIDAIEKISPQMADRVKSYFSEKVIKESLGKNGYDPQKLLDGVNKYRDVLRQSDKNLITEQAGEMIKSKQGLDDIEARQSIIGTSQIEMAKKIGKIDTIAKLKEFSDSSGKTPQELGKLYFRNVYQAALKNIGNIKGQESYIPVMREIIKGYDSLGGDTAESKDIRNQMMTDTDVKVAIENARQNIKAFDQASKIEPISLQMRAFNIAAGTGLLFLRHTMWGSNMLIRGLLPDSLSLPEEPIPIVKDAEGNLVREPEITTKKPTTRQKIKAIPGKIANKTPEGISTIKTIGGIQSNASKSDQNSQ